jgi:glycosyltransferase involved in cell wall biosynthesis
MKVSFLIPVYNEGSTIEELVERVLALPFEKQLVIIDDGSTDGSSAILDRIVDDRSDIRLLRQPNKGKGAALRAGIPLLDGEITVIQDADLEYDPADVPALIGPIEDGRADVVYGSRLSGGRPQRAYLFWHMVGNKFLSLVAGILYNTTLTDMETGYKAFRTPILQSLQLREDDFAIEPEITALICKRQLRIYELPIAYYGRTYAEGKKITWRAGMRALWVLIRLRVRQ